MIDLPVLLDVELEDREGFLAGPLDVTGDLDLPVGLEKHPHQTISDGESGRFENGAGELIHERLIELRISGQFETRLDVG
jgi:hypothetical protein